MYDDTSYESYKPQKQPGRNVFAPAAILLGVLSLFSSMIIYISLPCGALAILLAILSRTDSPMTKKAKTGLICGVAGMTATIILTVSAFYIVLSDSDMRSILEYYCQIYTGDSDFDLDELLEEMFPFIDNLETPSIELPERRDSIPSNPLPEEPSVIDPKGEGTFL